MLVRTRKHLNYEDIIVPWLLDLLIQKNLRKHSSLRAIDEDTQRLLDQAAKARAEADALEEELMKTRKRPPLSDSVSTDSAKKSYERIGAENIDEKSIEKKMISNSELLDKLSLINLDEAVNVFEKLNLLKKEGFCIRWQSANLGTVWPVSQGQLKNQAGIDNKSLNIDMNLDELRFSIGYVTIFSAICAILSGVVVGGNAGATLTYLFAVIPIVYLGIGSSSPGIILATINLLKIRLDPTFQRRRVVHEAAHFLAGYLCGLPVKRYSADGATTQVEFFDTLEGDQSMMGRKLQREEINVISVVALAGAVAEVQEFGSATGSAEDLEYLSKLMYQATPAMSAKDQEQQTRWAAFSAFQLLNGHKKELGVLVEAFSKRKSVLECIADLEILA